MTDEAKQTEEETPTTERPCGGPIGENGVCEWCGAPVPLIGELAIGPAPSRVGGLLKGQRCAVLVDRSEPILIEIKVHVIKTLITKFRCPTCRASQMMHAIDPSMGPVLANIIEGGTDTGGCSLCGQGIELKAMKVPSVVQASPQVVRKLTAVGR